MYILVAHPHAHHIPYSKSFLFNMQSLELEDNRRDSISTKDDASDIGVEDVYGSSGRSYDAAGDKRDMQRLGKRQELKVHEPV